MCGRIEVHAHRSFVIWIDRHALQTPFPPSEIELWNGPKFRLTSLHSVLIKAGARNPIATIATTINGQSTKTQKEISRSEFLGVRLLFILLSQALEERYFTKRGNFFRAALRWQTDPDRGFKERLRRRYLADRQGSYGEGPNELAATLWEPPISAQLRRHSNEPEFN